MSFRFTDAFGEELRIGDEVFFAGTDNKRRPTINKGIVTDLDVAKAKAQVLRAQRSGNAVLDSVERTVWVEVAKVGVIPSDL